MDITSDVHWQVSIFDFRLGNEKIGVTNEKIIFDTGSSLIYIPMREWNIFFDRIKHRKKCEYNENLGLFFCDCKDTNDPDYPTFSMYLGDGRMKHWFFMLPRDYL